MKPFITEHWNSFDAEKYYMRYKLSPYEEKSAVTIARIMEEMYHEMLYTLYDCTPRITIEMDKYTYSTLYRAAFRYDEYITNLRFRDHIVLISDELDHEIRMTGIKEDLSMSVCFRQDGFFSPIAPFNVAPIKITPIKITPTIKKVIFNKPATIVYWSDDTKTVVKCGKNDKWDEEKGLAMAISKKLIVLKEFYKQYNNTAKEKENKK